MGGWEEDGRRVGGGSDEAEYTHVRTYVRIL